MNSPSTLTAKMDAFEFFLVKSFVFWVKCLMHLEVANLEVIDVSDLS